jgi:hypothetical protein
VLYNELCDHIIQIDSTTCEFPGSLEFTPEMLGPAHDAKWACVYHQPPAWIVPFWLKAVGVVAGLLALVVIYKVINQRRQHSNERNGNAKSVVPTADDVKSMTEQQAANPGFAQQEVSLANPRFEL